MKSLAHQFLDFCRSKPADERYNYQHPSCCAFGQFLTESGHCARPSLGHTVWHDGEKWRPIPCKLPPSLQARPHTFGALTKRLEQALS